MDWGNRGTFAIRWSDSEVDGVADAPLTALLIGASWTWRGQALRVDGPQDVLILDRAHGAEELHRRAARSAARLAGPALPPPPERDEGRLDPDGPLRDGFTVTDGRRLYAVAILRTGPVTLLAFRGAMPAPGVEHWITSVTALPSAAEPPPAAVICFTAGTRLRTPAGERRVEEIMPGDLVLTRDDGPQPVVWTGRRRLSGARLLVTPVLRPVRIRARALDADAPDADLLVSPQHRILIRSGAARALFHSDEVLVAAADLIDDRAIAVAQGLREVVYHHLLLDRHQVLWANGVASESFHPAEAPLAALEPGQRAGLLALFPDLARDPARYGAPARRALDRAEAAILGYARGAGGRAAA